MGAIAGAIISVEILEASRAYWCLEQTGSRSSSSMVGISFARVLIFPGSLQMFFLLMSEDSCKMQNYKA